MPSTRQLGYVISLGQHLAVEVRQEDGGRAVVNGTVTAVPIASWGGGAMTIRVSATDIRSLPAEKRAGGGKRRGQHS
jgi:hypothetical protein